MVVWTVCTHKVAIAAFLLYFIVSGIHPAAVKCPVSASLVGRSSHVKLSVRSITRSILRCRNLIQSNQTVISGSLNVGKQSKDSRKFWISGCEIVRNEIPSNLDSGRKKKKHVLYVLSGVEAINISVSNVTILSKGKMFCHWYKNLVFEQNTWSVPKRRCFIRKAN